VRVRFGSGTHSIGDNIVNTSPVIDTSKYELAVSKMTVAEIEWELENLKGLILDNDDRRDYAILINELKKRDRAAEYEAQSISEYKAASLN
jgi:hypothetical protein